VDKSPCSGCGKVIKNNIWEQDKCFACSYGFKLENGKMIPDENWESPRKKSVRNQPSSYINMMYNPIWEPYPDYSHSLEKGSILEESSTPKKSKKKKAFLGIKSRRK
jgi:hypothetical protein